MTETIYLDYAATTPADPAVVESMTAYMGPTGIFANAASHTHLPGQEAAKAVEEARECVAELIGASPDEIIWTSGATESINLAIKGVAQAHRDKGRHIVTSCLEHSAVLDTCRYLATQGYEVTFLRPDAKGLITCEQVTDALRADTILVSLVHVNNELGTTTDIASIGDVLGARGIAFHVDAVQSAPRLPLNAGRINADYLSISAHKMYGPKGIGALYVRGKSAPTISPQMHGGDQELGLRAGTLATHQIVGMGKSALLLASQRKAETSRMARLDQVLLDNLTAIPGTYVNATAQRISGIVNVRFTDVDNESLMMTLRDKIAISSGSACTSTRVEPSHVLLGLGLSEHDANCSVRISLGRFTSEAQVKRGARLLREAVQELRELRAIA